jgi:hypothetical protein
MGDIDPTLGRRTATDKRPHVRMTNGFFTEPGKLSHIADPVERIATLGLLAASIGMCDDQGTDGHIKPEAVLEATGLPPQYAKTLMTDQAWHQADHGCRRCPQPRQDHIYVHDFLLHNRTAEQKQRTAERRRAAGGKGLSTRWEGHEKAQREPRRVGRPRKAAPATPELVVAPVAAPAAPVHPAELKTRRGPGRPRREVVFEPIVFELCEELAKMVRANGFSVGKLGPAWWTPCEQLLRIGPPNAGQGVTPEQIRKAMRWANTDGFWWEQIRSMKNLREKYEQLRSAAGNPNRPKRGLSGVNQQRRSTAPAALPTTGMAAMLARQMGTAQGGMVKGA